jgi:predicted transcriptional regulator
MFEPLDQIFLSQPRLAILSLLMKNSSAEFNEIKDATQITSGNLSAQLSKLREVMYIDLTKQFKGNYPLTICKITPKGVQAFNDFMKAINSYDENNISKVESEVWTPSEDINLQ